MRLRALRRGAGEAEPVRAPSPPTAAVPPTGDPDPGWTAMGAEGGPAIVLVPGSRLTRAGWYPVMARLATEFRVVALDLPGHGTRAAEPFTMAGAAAVIAVAIDQAAGGRAVVVGHSLGGFACIELAAASPARVRGLVLAGASQAPAGAWGTAFLAYARLLEPPFVGALDRLNDGFFRRRFGREVADPIIAGGYWSAAGAAGVREAARRDYHALLAAYPGRTLIVNGELDIIMRLGAPGFRRAARSPRRVTIPRSSHLLQLDAPGPFADAVAAFARSLEP